MAEFFRGDFVTGSRELDKRLDQVGNTIANKAMSSGIRAGMSALRKAIQANVTNPRVRKVVASRFKRKNKRHETQAKVGAGVGKHKAAPGSRGRPGVGISKQNAHWYFLGTAPRYTKDGARRGIMPNSNAVVIGYAQAKPAVLAAMHNAIRARIDKEVSKLKGSR